MLEEESPPAPILLSLTPPFQRIISPWCPCLANVAQRPIWRGGCRANGPDADGVLFLTSLVANWLVHYPTYFYIEHRLQEPQNVRQHVVT